MKKLLLAVLIAVSCVAFAPSYAKAEGGPTMGLGLNVNVGYGAEKAFDFMNKNGVGYGVEVFFNYFLMENLAITANWNYIEYTPTALQDIKLGATTLMVGLKFALPLENFVPFVEGDIGFGYWVMSFDNDQTQYELDDHNRLAFQAKAGFDFFFDQNWALNVNVQYCIPNLAGKNSDYYQYLDFHENTVSHIGGQVGVGYFF